MQAMRKQLAVENQIHAERLAQAAAHRLNGDPQQGNSIAAMNREPSILSVARGAMIAAHIRTLSLDVVEEKLLHCTG